MKQMLLLLLAVYSLIINQSNKSISHKKVMPASRVENKNRNSAVRSYSYPLITPTFPFEMINYTGSYGLKMLDK
jgi:hypothetical protein